jgi:hypothetical protein
MPQSSRGGEKSLKSANIAELAPDYITVVLLPKRGENAQDRNKKGT